MIRPPAEGSGVGRAGFTMVETVVVLLLLGLAAAAVAPDLRALLRPGSVAAAEELADVYRDARALAASRGRGVIVTLDPRTGVWRTFLGPTGSAEEAVDGGNLLTNRPGTLLRTGGAAPAAARFGPGGRARVPVVAVQRGDRALEVTVDPWTGAVHVR